MLMPKSWMSDLLILTLLLGLFFGFELGQRALWSPGEGHASEIAREMVASGDYVTPQLAGMKFLEKPPLFFWLESASIGLFGINEWSLRLWPAIFAMVGCLAVYFTGGRLFGRTTGLISSAVLFTSGIWYVMGHIINLDMAVSALLSCAMLSFLSGTKEPPGFKRRIAMWGFFVLSALAVLTKGLIGIIIPGLVIGVWIMFLGEWRILKTIYLPSGFSLFLLIAAPWFILVSWSNPDFLKNYFIHEHFQRYLTRPDGSFQQPWAYAPVLLLGFFPWTVFLVQALKFNLRCPWRERHEHKEIIFLVLWAGLVFLFFSGSSYKVIPYILPMFPPLAILVGRYLAAAWDMPQLSGVRAGGWILFFIISLLIVISLGTPQHYLERYSNWPSLEVPNKEATIVSTQRKEYGDLSALANYFYPQTATLIVGAVAMLFLLKKKRRGFRWGFLSLTLSWALLLVVVNSSLSALDDRRSIKNLASVLKSRLHPADEIATYHAYYQDLPVYLQRPVTIVNWKGNLEFGVELDEHAGGWMVDDATFWQRWNGAARIYAFTDRSTYAQLDVESNRKLYLIAQTDYDVLFSNGIGSRGG